MKKVLFVALSVNQNILNTHYLVSFLENIEKKYILNLSNINYDIHSVVYTQGFGSIIKSSVFICIYVA